MLHQIIADLFIDVLSSIEKYVREVEAKLEKGETWEKKIELSGSNVLVVRLSIEQK